MKAQKKKKIAKKVSNKNNILMSKSRPPFGRHLVLF